MCERTEQQESITDKGWLHIVAVLFPSDLASGGATLPQSLSTSSPTISPTNTTKARTLLSGTWVDTFTTLTQISARDKGFTQRILSLYVFAFYFES